MITIFTNIHKLLQVRQNAPDFVAGTLMDNLPVLQNAYLVVNNNIITDFGAMQNFSLPTNVHQIIDCTGRIVMPTFCDPHTHIVYAGSREIEFVDKIKGMSYQEIAKRGGGILNSAQLLAQTSEDELYKLAEQRLREIMEYGTGAVEIKSGYGLDTQNELKMLRVINRLSNNYPIQIKATFLGAHAVPAQFNNNQDDYVDLIINEMLPQVVAQNLADYIDVFCDKGFFTPHNTERILMAGIKYGLLPKIHANELGFTGGVQVGVKYNALSVDHLEYISNNEIECLLASETMPTVLPGAAFFLNMPLSPVRKMIEAGLPIALASDYNPGSSPSGNIKFIMSLACINYKMTPNEAINAVTINAAYALGLSHSHGSITVGKNASIIVTKPLQNYEFLPYAYTTDTIDKVMVNGQWVR